MRITHLGHACLLVEAGDVRVLIDPGGLSHGFEELTGLDAVLITHAHGDHYDAERLPALLDGNDGVRLITEPELAVELTKVGLDAAGLHPGESVALGGLTVAAVGGEHAVVHPDVPRIGNVGLLLTTAEGPSLFHPGDSYQTVPDGVDVLGVPLAAPWAALRETVDFVRAVRPRAAVPIHDGLVSGAGRGVYLGTLTRLGPDGTRLQDLAGAGPTGF